MLLSIDQRYTQIAFTLIYRFRMWHFLRPVQRLERISGARG